MRCIARLVAVVTTVLLLSAASSAVTLSRAEEGHGTSTPAPSAATHDHDAGHPGVAPAPSASAPDHHSGTADDPSAGTSGHDDHSTGANEPSGGHDEHGTTVAGTGPDADTRLLVLSLFAGVNGLVLMVASVQRSRTADARTRRRTARAAAPPAV